MSYDIETEKRCATLEIPKDDPRFPTSRDKELTLFCRKVCCNNLYPREPKWNVMTVGLVSTWDGRPMMPLDLWLAAADADGGNIKPGGRNVSGTAYMRQWLAAYTRRKPITADNFLTSIRVWQHGEHALDKVQDSEASVVAVWGTWQAALRRQAFLQLAGSDKGMVSRWTPVTSDNLLAAAFLMLDQKQLPFRVSVS